MVTNPHEPSSYGVDIAKPDNLALNLTFIHLLTRGGSDESVAQHLVRESQVFVE